MSQTDYRISFDTGGTFTDFALQNEKTGAFVFGKVPSTNLDPSIAVLSGMSSLLNAEGVDHGQLRGLYHATTVATNAILERRGAKCALVTTKGFRDIFMIGRQKRHETYDLHLDKPQPLTLRKNVFEVEERVSHSGEVLKPLNQGEIEALVSKLKSNGYQSVAICLMHSYANSAHEQRLADAIKVEMPEILISISSEVSPKYREYERTSTVLADAYIKPIVDQYINRMSESLAGKGVSQDFLVMQSNGGLVTPNLSQRFPVRIVESGPAAGVEMCAVIGRLLNETHLLTFDMGGTTAKLGAIDDGVPAISPTFEVDQVQYRPGSGLPLNISSIELLEIGAGGGSIATVDTGVIKVGPKSAGAEPGPICYGNGGEEPTITDANIVLGYLNPDYFNGGAMTLDLEAAKAGAAERIAKPLGIALEEAAWGIHAVANANMERAMRIVSIEKGRDPRRYAVVAFGGAGPLHACRLARSLGAPRVIVPYGAGVGSALGLLAADSRLDASTTRILPLQKDAIPSIKDIFKQLGERVSEELSALKDAEDVEWDRAIYARYVGQGYEIRVDLPDGEIDDGFLESAIQTFHEAYKQNYGYCQPDHPVEAADWNLTATVKRDSTALQSSSFKATARDAVRAKRRAYCPEARGFVDHEILNRAALRDLGEVVGPAVIEDDECTIVVPSKDKATISDRGDVIIEIHNEAS